MLLPRSLGCSGIARRCLARFGGSATVVRGRRIIGHAIRRLRRALVRTCRRCVCLGRAVQGLSRMSLSELDRTASAARPLDRRLEPLLAMYAPFLDRYHPTR
jgi:hypothetical protein